MCFSSIKSYEYQGYKGIPKRERVDSDDDSVQVVEDVLFGEAQLVDGDSHEPLPDVEEKRGGADTSDEVVEIPVQGRWFASCVLASVT